MNESPTGHTLPGSALDDSREVRTPETVEVLESLRATANAQHQLLSQISDPQQSMLLELHLASTLDLIDALENPTDVTRTKLDRRDVHVIPVSVPSWMPDVVVGALTAPVAMKKVLLQQSRELTHQAEQGIVAGTVETCSSAATKIGEAVCHTAGAMTQVVSSGIEDIFTADWNVGHGVHDVDVGHELSDAAPDVEEFFATQQSLSPLPEAAVARPVARRVVEKLISETAVPLLPQPKTLPRAFDPYDSPVSSRQSKASISETRLAELHARAAKAGAEAAEAELAFELASARESFAVPPLPLLAVKPPVVDLDEDIELALLAQLDEIRLRKRAHVHTLTRTAQMQTNTAQPPSQPPGLGADKDSSFEDAGPEQKEKEKGNDRRKMKENHDPDDDPEESSSSSSSSDPSSRKKRGKKSEKKEKKKKKNKKKRKKKKNKDDRDSSPSDSSDSSDTSSSDARGKAAAKVAPFVATGTVRREAETIKMRQYPTTLQLPSWRRFVRSSVAAASGRPDEANKWILEVEEIGASFESLACNDPAWASLSAKLCSALEQILKGDIARKVGQKADEIASRGGRIGGRQILWMIYQRFRPDASRAVHFIFDDLLVIKCAGTSSLESWLAALDEILAAMPFGTVLPDGLLTSIYLAELTEVPELEAELRAFKRLASDHENKNDAYLRVLAEQLLEDMRTNKQRDEIKKHQYKAGGESPPLAQLQASVAALEKQKTKLEREKEAEKLKADKAKLTCTVCEKTGHLAATCWKGKGKGKGKDGKGNKGKRPRSNSPAFVSKKDASGKTVCGFLSKAGGCKKGTDCDYSHAPAVIAIAMDDIVPFAVDDDTDSDDDSGPPPLDDSSESEDELTAESQDADDSDDEQDSFDPVAVLKLVCKDALPAATASVVTEEHMKTKILRFSPKVTYTSVLVDYLERGSARATMNKKRRTTLSVDQMLLKVLRNRDRDVENAWKRALALRLDVNDELGVSHGCIAAWIADTGSANDLVKVAQLSRKEVKTVETHAVKARLATANGVICADKTAMISVPKLNLSVRPLLLDNTPNVLSVGRRVVEDGWNFVWKSDGPCYFEKDGEIVPLVIRNFVPFLKTDDHDDASPALPVMTSDDDAQPDSGSSSSTAIPILKGDDTSKDDVVGSSKGAEALKAEALTLRHSMCHFPKNPFCRVCCDSRIKAIPARKRKKNDDEGKPKKFAERVHCDHTFVPEGLLDKVAALVLDDAMDLCDVYPGAVKDAESTMDAIKHFVGTANIEILKIDNSKELIATAKHLGVPIDPSSPYRHTSNAKVERRIGLVKEGTSTQLKQSGLPPETFWGYAAKYQCFAFNLHGRNSDKVPPFTQLGYVFDGVLVPFGAHVTFRLPDPVRSKNIAGLSECGVFVGYGQKPGCAWNREYIVCTEDTALDRSPTFHRVREIVFHEDDLKFPIAIAQATAKTHTIALKAVELMRELPVEVDAPTCVECKIREVIARRDSVDVQKSYAVTEQLRGARKYTGSKRPEGVWPEIWQSLTPKQRTALAAKRAAEKLLSGAAAAAQEEEKKDLIIVFGCNVDSRLEHECDRFGHDYVAFGHEGGGHDLVEVEKVCERIAAARGAHVWISLPSEPWDHELKNCTPAMYRRALKERKANLRLVADADLIAEAVRNTVEL
ncbi:unnamed protein product [Polarella glacialis]|uniref:C3H1-type domain-containing protein n=1 Tax=Polarella glacialis TaxID=89957 RepID=A0A813HW54_POLGL|nr:unnamed protein product [Polarella glacialis]